jgi:hypothetical protein
MEVRELALPALGLASLRNSSGRPRTETCGLLPNTNPQDSPNSHRRRVHSLKAPRLSKTDSAYSPFCGDAVESSRIPNNVNRDLHGCL